jgi:HlyD family secretion protein
MRVLLVLFAVGSLAAGMGWYASAGLTPPSSAVSAWVTSLLDDWRPKLPDWATAVLPASQARGADDVPWKLGTVTRGPVQSTILATGTLKPIIAVEVGSQISGQIVELKADFNTAVEEGQILARIDPATYRARLEQARADLTVADAAVRMQEAALERARSQVAAAESTTADAERTLARTEQLAKTGAASEKRLQADQLALVQARTAVSASRAQVRIAEAEVAVAKGQVQQRRAAVGIAEIDLERTIIRSPVRGVVVDRQVDTGQTVAASLQAPRLFEIAQDLTDMHLEASVDEADIGRVREGQQAIFGVDSHPGRRFNGRVVQVRKAPKLVQNVTTYAVVIEASNADLALYPGMTANVRIVQAHKPDAVKVPLVALRFSPAGAAVAPAPEAREGSEAGRWAKQRAGGGPAASEATVYTPDEDGKARPVPIVLGLVGDNDAEVVSGLTIDDAIIVGHAARTAQRPSRSPPGL